MANANKELSVRPRSELGKAVRKLRRAGQTPANIFGHRVESRAVQAETPDLLQLLRASTRNAIINLRVEGEGSPRTVVVRDVQRDPVTGRILHVDFYQVSMTEKMRAEVPVVLVGTSDAVATYGGVLLQTLERIAVEALPAEIPAQFEADVSVLTELEQSIHVRDLKIDETRITVHTDPDVVVARVAAPRLAAAEEEEAAAAAEEGAPAPEGEAPAAAPAEAGETETSS
jgi:large subunit ribosomal protein L25